MDILLINGTHPAAPHISGVRAGRFAAELARMGHRCVLICPPVPGANAALLPSVPAHDWSEPLIIEADHPGMTRGGNKIATFVNLLRYGGRCTAFQRSVVARGRALAADFRPNVGWATFGSLEAVTALRTLAREQRFQWIFDNKDNPEIFIPRAARLPLAWRLRGYAALQANSVLHADAAQRWLGDTAEVIYSGVDACFFEPHAAPKHPQRYVTLVGSLYRGDMVDAILRAIAEFNATSALSPVSVVHVGKQGDWIRSNHGVDVELPGYVSTDEMARLCQHALANVYVFTGLTFHHKLFELLACRRPVIAYGGELPESIAEAKRLHAPLTAPTDRRALVRALAATEHFDPDPRMPKRFFTWSEQAALVEAAMRRIIG
ncbi:glycosyltransferase [Sphingomonas mali]|uniref:glycosyltransferase n=1 Tax=Sphingomonas mali TaxID=40682 RepID=UPI000834BAD7|nr:glycosyltransferase [Sphingomonas mali]